MQRWCLFFFFFGSNNNNNKLLSILAIKGHDSSFHDQGYNSHVFFLNNWICLPLFTFFSIGCMRFCSPFFIFYFVSSEITAHTTKITTGHN